MAQIHHLELEPRDAVAELGRWSVPVRIDWRAWDGEFVVRVDDTATTYLLSRLAGQVLVAMREGATYADDIARRVFADGKHLSTASAVLVAAFAGTTADTQQVLAVLTELEALGLARVELV